MSPARRGSPCCLRSLCGSPPSVLETAGRRGPPCCRTSCSGYPLSPILPPWTSPLSLRASVDPSRCRGHPEAAFTSPVRHGLPPSVVDLPRRHGPLSSIVDLP